jgi:aspartate racemase
MPIIGLIGGIAPPSTIEYYKLLIEKYRARNPDSFPHILINSIDLSAMLALVAANNLDALTDLVVREIDRLARAGAELAIITSNTTHIVYDRVQPRARIPLVSIVEATRDHVLALGMRRVGLIGSRFVTEGTFYSEVFARKGLAVVVPGPAERAYIDKEYQSNFIYGRFPAAARVRILEIVTQMARRDGIDGVIIGGTELPLALGDTSGLSLRFFNSTLIHVERVIDLMYPARSASYQQGMAESRL